MRVTTTCFIALLSSLSLARCAMSRNDCEHLDWGPAGRADAFNAASDAALTRFKNECVRWELTADEPAYRAAYAEGMKEVCTSSYGFEDGTGRASRATECPAESRRLYELGFVHGQPLRPLQSEIWAYEREIRELENQLGNGTGSSGAGVKLTVEQQIAIRRTLADLRPRYAGLAQELTAKKAERRRTLDKVVAEASATPE